MIATMKLLRACHVPRLALGRSFLRSRLARTLALPALAVSLLPGFAATRVPTPVSEITVPAGFKVEMVRAGEENEGSWVSICKDSKGRLIISPQDGQPLLRFTLKDGKAEKVEPIELKAADGKKIRYGSAMGLLYAYDSLYMSGNGPEGLALYRITDKDGDDQFDTIEVLQKFEGASGEHGSHALVLGPEGKIYYIHGNFTKVPSDILPTSPHKNFADDVLLPRGEDGNGFGRGLKPPGGFILRGDKNGKNWELVAAGMRNTYDFAFNSDGEIFGFDSDMEWDWSMPWYRPTRIYHLVSGGEYGFREGTAKWPAYYPDALPPTLDVGIGSPTGVIFGYGAKFPAKYQKAMFAMDWSYGRIFAFHLTPNGSTYSADKEVFVKGKPLPLTDMVVGDDGALYFMIGGRKTATALYRVIYTGNENTAPAAKDNSGAEARNLRRQLEGFHGRKNPKAVDIVWPNLGSKDRFIRYGARIALESQDTEAWAQRALDERDTQAGLTALLALARRGSPDQEAQLMESLGQITEGRELSRDQKFEAIRILQVAMTRMGRPNSELRDGIVQATDHYFPSSDALLDREMAQVLIYLDAPNIVERCLAKVRNADTFEEQMYYMFHLRTVKTGWTRAQREEYFNWFNRKHEGANSKHPTQTVAWFTEAGRDYSDGSSFPKFIANAKADAVAALSDAERGELAAVITGKQPEVKVATAPVRAFVKEWKTADLADSLGEVSHGRNFKRGKEAFTAAQCYACHRFGNEGGSVGPEMTTVSSRFTRRDILESIVEPSKVVSEQFQSTDFTLKDGESVSGRILEENDQRYVVLVNPLANIRTEVKKSDVAKRAPAKLSMMPEGLVNVLNKDEILDMLAYIESGGKENAPLFKN
jgi:putative heme-binding domain-containing protein